MNLFDRMVDEVMRGRPEWAALQQVVEKELLHHDILREMARAGLLATLTFIGGTCLRACYGSERLSEDLDFAGGAGFSRAALGTLAEVLKARIGARYGLPVEVSEPRQEITGGVATWKLRLVTRPERRDLPAQRIHIDVCALPSHDRRPMMLRNRHGLDMGTSGLILQAASREEILADKLMALALRPNRPKQRDLWDIGWLKRQGVTLPARLIPLKIEDHRSSAETFRKSLRQRVGRLRADPQARHHFVAEMRRFLPAAVVRQTIETPAFWDYLIEVVDTEAEEAMQTAG